MDIACSLGSAPEAWGLAEAYLSLVIINQAAPTMFFRSISFLINRAIYQALVETLSARPSFSVSFGELALRCQGQIAPGVALSFSDANKHLQRVSVCLA